MNKLLAVLAASTFAIAGTALAADAPAAKPAADKAVAAKLEKPANVTADAWAKMTDAEKQKAVDAAKMAAKPAAAAATTAATPPKKEKKGGC